MDDNDDDTPRPPPAHWLEAIAESDAQLAAGQTVPLEPLLEEMRRALERLEASLAGRREPKPVAASNEP